MISKDLKIILKAQRNEITELKIYRYLKDKEQNLENRRILERISQDEENHYRYLRSLTKKDLRPNKIKFWFYILLTKIFGLAFTLKLMEQGEKLSLKAYQALSKHDPKFAQIFQQEQKHEELLLHMLKDSRLEYVSSFVLGLNDALVELTGALAGLTLSLVKTKLIGFVGFITGIAAALSMSASEYLSTKEDGHQEPSLAALITGIAYFLTVLVLISPYFIFKQPIVALLLTLGFATVIIFAFNFYVSVVRNEPLRKRFFEMFLISFGVALFNFALGFLVKKLFNLEI